MFFVVSVLIYFFVMCLLAWLTLFPAGRQLVYTKQMQLLQKATQLRRLIGQNIDTQATQLLHSTTTSVDGFKNHAQNHYLLALLCLCMLALPVLFSILMSNKNLLDGFEDTAYEENTHIASILEGEQLVAPIPLPPEVFTTTEVAHVRPMLANASRDWNLLNPTFRQKLLTVFKIMNEQYGYEMALIEGYRSPQRQEKLALLGSNVTNAKAFQSYHQYGKAADCAFYKNGKLIISERDPWAMRGYELYGKVAQSVGLTWGGNWKMMDFGHTELRGNRG